LCSGKVKCTFNGEPYDHNPPELYSFRITTRRPFRSQSTPAPASHDIVEYVPAVDGGVYPDDDGPVTPADASASSKRSAADNELLRSLRSGRYLMQ